MMKLVLANLSAAILAAAVLPHGCATAQSTPKTQALAPITTPAINTTIYVANLPGFKSTVQAAVTQACGLTGARIVIVAGYTPPDTPPAATGGCSTAGIYDENQVPILVYNWSGTSYQTVATGASVSSVGVTTTSTANLFTAAVTNPTANAQATFTLANAAVSNVWMGPAPGSSGPPGYRLLTVADLPASYTALTVTNLTAANIYLTGITPSTSPLCNAGAGGQLTTVGCTGAAGTGLTKFNGRTATNVIPTTGDYNFTQISGILATGQVPALPYVPTSQVGVASGVASLDTNARLPQAQSPLLVGSCQPVLSSWASALPTGAATGFNDCRNEWGRTWTLTFIRCKSDSGASSLAVTDYAGNNLLSASSLTCGTSDYATGTLTATTSLLSIVAGKSIRLIPTGDGVSNNMSIDVVGTY